MPAVPTPPVTPPLASPAVPSLASARRFVKLVSKIGTSPHATAKDEIRQKKQRRKKGAHVIKETGRYASALGFRPICITLTYKNNIDFSTKHISAFFDKARRWAKREGFPLPYIWTLERAHQLHYHLTVWLPASLKLDISLINRWWKWGSTWVERCRSIKRWGKYITKFVTGAAFLPKGARVLGYGGIDTPTRQKIARGGWPVWLKALVPLGEHARRLKGGGWVNLFTGEVHFSPYVWLKGRIVLKALVGL